MSNGFRARIAVCMVLAAGLSALISCQPPAANNGATAPTTAEHAESRLGHGPVDRGPVRDLSQDERAGGHILRKHVGLSEEDLRRRLQREENISGASTYTDRQTAEHVVGAAIAQSQDQIQNWINRQGRHPNLVLDYDTDEPIGRTMNRGEVHSHPCTHALVVLKYAGPSNYYVLTSYPECR